MFGEIRRSGPVWDVESDGPACVLVVDCQWPQSRACLKPETMTVTFEEFSSAHDFFDYRRNVTGVVLDEVFSPTSVQLERLVTPCDYV